MEATKSALLAVSDWPLSIVIVGIGNRDFNQFEELKEDILSRSIYHFLDLKIRIPRDSLQTHSMITRSRLQKPVAMELLSQVPAQFAEWMSKSGKVY